MASISFVLDSTNALRALKRLMKTTEDLRPVLEDIGEYVERTVEDRFDRKVGPSGRPWKRLKPSTKASKRNKNRILIEKGRMAESLGRNVGSNYVDVGFSDRKAVWHQFGTKPYRIVPKRKRALAFTGANGKRVVTTFVNHPGLPARPMLGINRLNAAEINRIIARHAEKAWEG